MGVVRRHKTLRSETKPSIRTASPWAPPVFRFLFAPKFHEGDSEGLRCSGLCSELATAEEHCLGAVRRICALGISWCKHSPEKWPRRWAVRASHSPHARKGLGKREWLIQEFLSKQLSNTKQDDRNEAKHTSNHNNGHWWNLPVSRQNL